MDHDPDFIVSFFGTSTTEDSEGRTLNDILRYNNQALEYSHDYIQLLFPLPEPSPFNPDAPLITPSVRAAFLSYPGLRERLLLALERMLQFYGFGLNPSYTHKQLAVLTAAPADDDRRGPLIGKSANFDRRARASWLKGMDHNHLRLTRMIRSLRVLGLEVLGVALWRALVEGDEEKRVGERTKMFWERAAIRGLWLPPSEGDDGAVGVSWLREAAEEIEEEGDAEDEASGEGVGREENGEAPDGKEETQKKTNASEIRSSTGKQDSRRGR